ncbi:hypothetical protein GGS20DRAFT_544445 [Poronia punctata]|nr:hypothetical protein GGS20DRAFT_544445 [Poronia punctata]
MNINLLHTHTDYSGDTSQLLQTFYIHTYLRLPTPNHAMAITNQNVPAVPLLNPAKDKAEEAERLVRDIAKQKPWSWEVAGTELTPIFGLGLSPSITCPCAGTSVPLTQAEAREKSLRDPLARMRAQGVFRSPETQPLLSEFSDGYRRKKGKGQQLWDLPVAKWGETLKLIKERRNDVDWVKSAAESDTDDANEKYAKLIITFLYMLENEEMIDRKGKGKEIPKETKKKGSSILSWLRGEDEDDASWVFFHALLFLQLEAMRLNKSEASFKERALHYCQC